MSSIMENAFMNDVISSNQDTMCPDSDSTGKKCRIARMEIVKNVYSKRVQVSNSDFHTVCGKSPEKICNTSK